MIAIAFIVLGAPPQPGNHSVDWGSIHSFAGTYHAVTVQDGGNREEGITWAALKAELEQRCP